MNTTDILIVGAGPTGLVLANELARRGVDHRIIERSARPFDGSRGKGVQPRSLEIFETIGIADALIANGRFDIPMLLHAKEGTQLLDQSGEAREGAPYRSTLLTPQWRVEGLLRSRLAELGSEVEWATELTGIDQEPHRVVARVLARGSEDRIEARWLVGCDGGQSTVRKTLGIRFGGKTEEHIRMWVGDLVVDGLDRDHWHLWHGEDGFLALCPLPGTNQFQLQAQIAADERREPSLAAFADLVRQRTGRNDIHLLDAGWLSPWRANVRMAERFRLGRTLLAGDAAHVHSPAGAQGMNTGIQDAYNLAWKLAAVLTGAETCLIDTYQEERLPIARGVLDLSSELTRTAFSPAMRRDRRATQLDLSYRGSSLSTTIGAVSQTIAAGDRAPDATGLRGPDGNNRRLFELMRGPCPTIIIFADAVPEAIRQAIDQTGNGARLLAITAAGTPAPGCWVDDEGTFRRLYAPLPGGLFVVRPDGYVGLTGSIADTAGLDRYLRAVTGTRNNQVPKCGSETRAVANELTR